MRTVRCRNDQKPGTLGHLLIAIADQGGDIGEIRLVQETNQAMIRDITIYLDDEEQLERVLAVIAANPGTPPGVASVCMKITADLTPPEELVPNPLDKQVHQAVARAVARVAIDQGLARADFVPYAED